MKLQIGSVIKQYRRQREITQEEFAEALGVSGQSVSRWELGLCYPDMEFLPVIAGFFGISVDQLMGINDRTEQRKVEEYLARFQEAISKGQIDACISIAREGVAEYPNNYALLNKLMYALFVAGDETGNIPNWKENMEKYDGEITALGERIMKYCPDTALRLEATARLAFHHCEQGRKATGRALFETLPSAKHFCKEQEMWWALEEDERLGFTRELVQIGYDYLVHGLYLMADARLVPNEEVLKLYQKMEELEVWFYDGVRKPSPHWGGCNRRYQMARVLCRLGRREEALEQLQAAADIALAFDQRPETWVEHTLLLGEKTHRRTEFDTADDRPLVKILGESWMAQEDFDPIRETEAFQTLRRQLTAT